jgi:quinolinate synthase
MPIPMPLVNETVPPRFQIADEAGTRALQAEIRALAKEKKAIILAHNYQLPEVIEIADVVGDSLYLAMEAAKVEVERIVFCGVHFMAESAKVLNPGR